MNIWNTVIIARDSGSCIRSHCLIKKSSENKGGRAKRENKSKRPETERSALDLQKETL